MARLNSGKTRSTWFKGAFTLIGATAVVGLSLGVPGDNGAAGCGGDIEDGTEQVEDLDGVLRISENTPTGMVGMIEIDDGAVSFNSWVEGSVFQLSVDINGRGTFEMSIDEGTGNIVTDAGGIVLTAGEKDMLLAAAKQIPKAEGFGEVRTPAFTLSRGLDWLVAASEANSTERWERKYDSISVSNKDAPHMANGNDSISCVKEGYYYKGYWDALGKSGTKMGVCTLGIPASWCKSNLNVNECGGRCGIGCPGRFGGETWSMDCLEHDHCTHANNEKSYGDCMDEFQDADEDWMATTKAAGCYGDNETGLSAWRNLGPIPRYGYGGATTDGVEDAPLPIKEK